MSAVDGEASQAEATPFETQTCSGDGSEDEHERWFQTYISSVLESDGQVQRTLLDGALELPSLEVAVESDRDVDAFHDPEIDQEIAQLLNMRETVSQLLDTSDEYVAALKAAVLNIRAAYDEMLQLKEYLDRTEELFASDQRREGLSIHRERVSLPMFPSIQRDIPRLAYQAKEIADLRLLSWRHRWTPKDSSRLESIVLNQCKKIVTMQHASDASVDALSVAAGMTDERLALVTLAADDENGNNAGGDNDAVDWKFVAATLGTWHTPDECRTHWLMKQRPGLHRDETLSATQLTRLSNGVTHYSRQNDGLVMDWEHIASRMNNGLLAIDCLSLAQRHGMMPAFAATMPPAWAKIAFRPHEAQEVEKLCGVWGNRLVIITERLGTMRPKSSVGTRVSRLLAAGIDVNAWSRRADEGLISYLCRTLNVRRPKLFAEPHRADKVDWSGQFAGKRDDVAPEQVKARWLHILEEAARDPGKYLKNGKSNVNAVDHGSTKAATNGSRQKRARDDEDLETPASKKK